MAQSSIPQLWKCSITYKIRNPKSVISVLRPILHTYITRRFCFPLVVQYMKYYIEPNQFGNLKNCSTTHALIHLIHRWLAALDKPRNSIKACMIDFPKASDRIDHNILLHKLQQLDIPRILLNFCCDCLHNRSLRVKLGQQKSSWRSINAGIPQEKKLGRHF